MVIHEVTFSEFEQKQNSYNLALSPGFYYFLTKRLSFEIEASLLRMGYSDTKDNQSNVSLIQDNLSSRESAQDGFNISYDLSAFEFSVSWYL